MPDFAVSTTFKGRDKLTGVLNKMGRSADKFGNSLTSSILKANVVSKGLGLLQQGVANVASEFIQFDDAITASSAKFSDMNLATDEGQKKLLELKKTARDVGAVTKFSAAEAAQGLDFYATAGFKASEAMAILQPTAKLSMAANLDLARTADIASDSMGIFGLSTKDPIQLQKNFIKMSDQMSKTMTSSNVTLEQMFETTTKAGLIFRESGQEMSTFNALVRSMADSSLKGAEAGTGLKALMAKLAKPTGAAANMLSDLNVETKDSKGNFLDLFDILGDMEKGFKGMGTQEKLAAVKTIFGIETMGTFSAVMATGTEKLREYRREVESSTGATDKMAEIMSKSLGNRLKSLQSALIEIGFKFFTAFEKKGAGAIDIITDAVRNFNMKPIIDGVKSAVTLFSQMHSVIQPIIPFLPVLIKGFLLYSVVLKGLLALNAAKNFLIFVNVLRQAAVAQGILNVVMTANPIGLIAVAIAGLIGIIILLVKNWDVVVDVFGSGISKIWNWFSGLLDNPFFATLSTIFLPFITIPALIIKHWAPIKAMFGSIGDKFSAITGAVGGFFGFGGDDEAKAPQTQREAPNKTEIEARQQIGFAGKLQIAGAPEGSKVESKTTGAPPIDVEMLGQNI